MSHRASSLRRFLVVPMACLLSTAAFAGRASAQRPPANPANLQLPQCVIQVSGYTTSVTEVKVVSVTVVDGNQSDRLALATPVQVFAPNGPKVLRSYSKLAACPRGNVEVSLEMTGRPPRTALFRTGVPVNGQTTIELADVKRLF